MAKEVPIQEERIAISNRKARHDYEVVSTMETGIVLRGSEVKSIRFGNANLLDSYAQVRDGEVWLSGMHINPYEHAAVTNHDPRRERKLLLHRKEIRKLIGKTAEKGLTLIPLKVYFKDGRVKVEIGLCRGKKSYDKRAAIAERESERELRRHSHVRNTGE
ncbi:MAG: SsrA-binding protein SmpB [Ignavibacteriales bacterium]|nr:SsrA-binding protein SmpB [Ignavibacteriales bacterium]